MGAERPSARAYDRMRWRVCKFAIVVAIALILSAVSEMAHADESAAAPARNGSGDSTNQALLQKIEALEQRLEFVEAQNKQRGKTANVANPPATTDNTSSIKPPNKSSKRDDRSAAATETAPDRPPAKSSTANTAAAPDKAVNQPADKPILGLTDLPVPGLSIGAYGEVYFGAMQNPAAGGQWQNGFDARRVVLLPTYAITDNIIFNAEIEFEHAGSGFDNDDKLHGTAEIEQVWIDFKFSDPISWRAPGVDLVPIGYINQHHEPTQFYSVLRPELYNGLIPSTWKVPGTSVYGTIMDGVRYQVMLSLANEDFGDAFNLRTAAGTVPPFPTPYFPGVDGHTALAFSNPPLGDFLQLNGSLAISGEGRFRAAGDTRSGRSVSSYYAPNIEPRGAHGDLGNPLGTTSMGVYDAELRYRIPQTWAELRGESVRVTFGNPDQPACKIMMAIQLTTLDRPCMASPVNSICISQWAPSLAPNGRPCHSIATRIRTSRPPASPEPMPTCQQGPGKYNTTMSASQYSRPRR